MAQLAIPYAHSFSSNILFITLNKLHTVSPHNNVEIFSIYSNLPLICQVVGKILVEKMTVATCVF